MSNGEQIQVTDEQWRALQDGIVEWWNPDDYDFPWRAEGEPEWKLLVTEVLLQRTRAEAVADLYDSFFERFPFPRDLGETTVEEIEEAIYSLGLRWRAKYLKQLGQELAALSSEVPATRKEIESFPGVGPYVAGAFLSLHRNQRAPFIDANIVRLLGRYLGFDWDGETRRRRWFKDLVERFFHNEHDPLTFGYAVLDFTREVCSSSPDHEACPAKIRSRCSSCEESHRLNT